MTYEETRDILATIRAAYPNNFKNMTATDADYLIKLWIVEFPDIPADIVMIAALKAISVSEFPPSVATIRKMFRPIYIESDIAYNQSKIGTPERERYFRIKKILQPYFSARNCPEIALCDILNNLSFDTLNASQGATSREIRGNTEKKLTDNCKKGDSNK